MSPRCLPAFPPALNEGFHPGTQLDDPRPGQPLRVGIFTSHFCQVPVILLALGLHPMELGSVSSGRIRPCSTQGLPAWRRYSLSPYSNGLPGEIEARDSGSVTHLQQLPSGTEAPVAWACDDHETRRPRSPDPLCGLVSIT